MGCTVVSAQTGLRRDTVSVYFGSALSQVDSSFGGNAGVLDSLNALISRYSRRPGFSLSIKGTSSPDGTQKFNQWLSERRTENFAEYIKAFDDTVSIGVDWEGLERDILEYGPFPGSEQVLDIVRNTPLQIIEDGKIVGSRKKSLMDLRGGRVFNYMMEHIFPLQRRVEVI
ncbi:MAG TPA: hypothetical protein IAC03_06215, partial [Candidatus Coprenecus pullistercoris]|nr:hypothetical protein [Candidatus Coprenecus pullistercoris]